jgi:alkylation response protein AidB-like acyl-CoA dehydrogenase
MLHHLARLIDQGHSIRVESALAKIHLSECFLENSLDAVKIQGARGYTEQALAVTDLNDSIAGLMIGGTNDIQRSLVARLLGI